MRGPSSLVILTLTVGLLAGWLEIQPRATANRVDDSTTSQHVDSREQKEDHHVDISGATTALEVSGDDYDDEDGDQEDMDDSNPLYKLTEAQAGHTRHGSPREGGFCGIGQGRCDDGRCYPLVRRCDGERDCSDGSDERGCLCHATKEWQCDLGICIPRIWRCNGVPDCPGAHDVSDETGCPQRNSPPLSIRRGHHPQRTHYHHGQTHDKLSLSPEIPDPAEDSRSPKKLSDVLFVSDDWTVAGSSCDDRLHYTCANGQCIGRSLVCDGLNDCRDKSDESSCSNAQCAVYEFRCGDGTCIPRSARCDGRKDCRDGEDEGPHCPQPPSPSAEITAANHSTAATSGVCRPGEFRCGDGSCIHGGRRCNRVIDCRHGEDEMGCEADRGCAASEFKCPQDGLCIRQNQLCDGVLDCTGGDDEANCGHHRGMGPDHSSGVSKDAGKTHHPKHPNLPDDSSNEERRREHERRWRQEMERRRIEEQHRTQQQQQYEQEMARRRAEEARRSREHWEQKERQQEEEERLKHKEETAKKVDDALKWIEDALKEANTGAETGAGSSRHGQCLPGEFACRTHDQCVAAERRCDRRRDCFDGSDEANCCSSGELQCGDGSCVLSHSRCDGRRDCPDGTDETNCPDQKLCGASKFHCGDGQCIKDVLRCDGYYDCNNFADEQNCEFHDCAPAQFKCQSGLCIARDEFCDGVPQCPDRSDELDCWRCQPSQFTCTNGQCIERGHRCDGKLHCADASDENGCSVSDIDVRVYPPFQNETVGHNVVIRCRDEGPRRLKVRWARADGRPLKSGHSEHRGRLTLPRVTLDDAGVYLCLPLSVDGQELRPSQKSATLVVTARVYPPSLAPTPPHSRSYDPYYSYVTDQARRQRRQRTMAGESDSPEMLDSNTDVKYTVPMEA